MCGISGLYSSKEGVLSSYMAAMLDAVKHRGPDDRGIVCFKTKDMSWHSYSYGDIQSFPDEDRYNLFLGHVRLSIIDVSEKGHQPMATADKNFWITYNGEIYNYSFIRQQLKKKGYAFFSNTDTEVILYAYKEYGAGCLDLLRGMFAFCIYDKKQNSLFLARDRLGQKPLKYYWDGKYFAFSSEISSLLRLPFIPRNIDLAAIDQYLSYKYIPAPLTGLKNIYKLPAGCSMTIRLEAFEKGPSVSRYWTPSFSPKSCLSYTEAAYEAVQRLKESVCMRLMSDVPLGVFLSGGIDSGAIVALLREAHSGRIRTFSVGFADEKFDERPYAQMIAKRFDTEHTEFVVALSHNEDIADMISFLDEPFGDPSFIPSFCLARETSSFVKVVLNGDGGDEVFSGYKRYSIHTRNRYLDYLPKKIFHAVDIFLKKTPLGVNKKKGWGKIGRLMESVSGDLIQTYPLRFSGLSPRLRAALYSGKFLRHEIVKGWPDEVYTLLEKTGAYHHRDKLLAIDQLTYLPEYILMKSDMCGMAFGLEARSPFLDHKFIGWANRLPASYKTGGMGKPLLRDALNRYLPSDILHRKKAGFSPPVERWTRAALKDPLKYYLISDSSPLKFLDKDVMKRMLSEHFSCRANLSEPLWSLLVLAMWYEKNRIID